MIHILATGAAGICSMGELGIFFRKLPVVTKQPLFVFLSSFTSFTRELLIVFIFNEHQFSLFSTLKYLLGSFFNVPNMQLQTFPLI